MSQTFFFPLAVQPSSCHRPRPFPCFPAFHAHKTCDLASHPRSSLQHKIHGTSPSWVEEQVLYHALSFPGKERDRERNVCVSMCVRVQASACVSEQGLHRPPSPFWKPVRWVGTLTTLTLPYLTLTLPPRPSSSSSLSVPTVAARPSSGEGGDVDGWVSGGGTACTSLSRYRHKAGSPLPRVSRTDCDTFLCTPYFSPCHLPTSFPHPTCPVSVSSVHPTTTPYPVPYPYSLRVPPSSSRLG
jgi:hypothetical protein